MSTEIIEELIDDFLVLLPHIKKKLLRPMEDCFKRILTPMQVHVLMYIYEKKTLNMSDIADGTNVSRQQLTHLIDGLEHMTLVTRTLNKEDRRSVIVSLSSTGQDFVESRKKYIKESVKDAMSKLSEKDLSDFHNALQTIFRIINNI